VKDEVKEVKEVKGGGGGGGGESRGRTSGRRQDRSRRQVQSQPPLKSPKLFTSDLENDKMPLLLRPYRRLFLAGWNIHPNEVRVREREKHLI
jgi:hypothetical protein